MKQIEIYNYAKKHGVDEKLCSYLLKHHIHIKEDGALNKFKALKFKIAINKLKHMPIQYIIGNVDFYGYTFKVNKNTLIPRFETEQLVEQTLKYIKEKYKNKNIEVLDLCTGSGCIGITLKREIPSLSVTITDISRKALKVAKKNAKNLNIKVVKSNLLKELVKKNKKYDVIISNPPYISNDEIIEDIVKNNEPNIALFAENDGLYYYERILKDINKIINKDFVVAFEIGSKQKQKVTDLVHKHMNNIDIVSKKDLQNRDRMIFIFNKKV